MLCDLQGLTREEAAGLLGWPPGTVGGRLNRARKQLRERLERRGIAPSVVMAGFCERASDPGLWRSALEGAIRNTAALATGGLPRPAAIGLSAGAGRGFMGLAAQIAAVLGVVAVIAIGVVLAQENPKPRPAVQPGVAAAAGANPAATFDPEDPKLAGHYAGRVLDREDRPVAGARIFVVPTVPMPDNPGPVRAVTGADGRFEFDAPDMSFTEIDGLPARLEGLVMATADGFQPEFEISWGQTPVYLRVGTLQAKGPDLELRLRRGDVPIHGRLLDEKGQPLAGTSVKVCTIWMPPENQLAADLKAFAVSKGAQWPFNYEKVLHRPEVLPGISTEAIADADGRIHISGLGRDRLVELLVTAPSVVDTYLTAMTRDAADVIYDREISPPRGIRGAGFTVRLKPGARSAESCATARRMRRSRGCGSAAACWACCGARRLRSFRMRTAGTRFPGSIRWLAI